MRTLFLFQLLTFLFSCGNSQQVSHSSSPSEKVSVDIYDSVVYPIEKKSKELNSEVIKSILNKTYFKNNPELRVELQKKVRNSVDIYSVKLLGSLPTSLNDDYTLINIKSQGLQYLLPIEFNHYFNFDDKTMIGGIYSYREFEYYFIYEIEKGFLKLVLDTRNINGKQVKVGYYKDDECIDYKPDRLDFDFDNHHNELRFRGLFMIYCREGADRQDDSNPIEEKSINVVIRYHERKWQYFDSKSNYLFW